MSPVRVRHSPYVERGLPRRLLVDRHLAFELHVVEHHHLLQPDDGHLPHLVRVEPGQVHVRDAAGREAEEAEHDVLDPALQPVDAVRDRLGRLLAEEPEDHGEVVHAERPERVLVRADPPEVHAVAVHDRDLAELAAVDELLHLPQPRVVEQQVAGHEHEAAGACQLDQLLHLRALHRRRLLDEDVLAGLEGPPGEGVVRGDGRCDHDGFDLVVREGVRVRVGDLRGGVARRVLAPPLLVRLADPGEVG